MELEEDFSKIEEIVYDEKLTNDDKIILIKVIMLGIKRRSGVKNNCS